MRRHLALPLALAAALLALAGCGSERPTSGGASGAPARPQVGPSPGALRASFPSAQGQGIRSLTLRLPHGPILAPSTASSLEVGGNRFGFALFAPDKTLISDARVALYVAGANGGSLRGPYLARRESLTVAPRFRSRTTAQDPDAAASVYVARLPLRAGRHQLVGIADIGGRMTATTAIELDIPRRGVRGGPPDVGQRPPRIHTPTLASVHGDAARIDTRVPPARDLLRVDFAKALGRRPIVITFATPLLCQSRVCGPVVDVVEEVRAESKRVVAFIHQEIYRDNQVAKGFRPQVLAWHLPTEPWTFVIDRRGIVRARFEGAVGAAELRRAVAKVE